MKITEFEVDSLGTLTVAEFWELKTRTDVYESVSGSWSKSLAHLADAMEECEPLAWAVHSIYTELRSEIQADLGGVGRISGALKKRALALKARIKTMPEEPVDNADHWLFTLTSNEFNARFVSGTKKWFDSPPNWKWEDDHLPNDGTAQWAALEYFKSMDDDTLDILGVRVIAGDHPGSSYYAAKRTGDLDQANRAAADAGIPARFKKSSR